MIGSLLEISNLVKRFGGLIATDDFSLSVPQGELHAIIGPNGAGKTSLIAQLAGDLRSDAGRIVFAGEDVTGLPTHVRAHRGIGRSFQITSVFREFTVLDNAALAMQARSGHSFRFWRRARSDEALRAPARAIIEQVGLGDRMNVPAANLAHGEKRALELALALAATPRLLLLDEPMAGMGTEDSARIVRFLTRLKRKFTIVLIEHDMDAVFELADRITVMVYGRAIATGDGDSIRNNDEVRRAYLGEDDEP
jgi:branched-chain amino acid transport system ATP-binding protein